jgi:fucose permease
MTTIILILIYLAFVSMGLPDALLGSAWPSIYRQLDVSVSLVGVVTILISTGTVISSLFSSRLDRRFGAGKITAFSTLLTAVALFGFSRSASFIHLCLWAIPYGLGAGSIDVVLNNYAALHFKSSHMNWIHFSWGLGAASGPYLMGLLLSRGEPWTFGYRLVGILQLIMTLMLFLSLPLWQKDGVRSPIIHRENDGGEPGHLRPGNIIHLPGVKSILPVFFCYSALEVTTGLWASSYLVLSRGLHPIIAAKWASLFYLGITGGRAINGFIANRFSDTQLIRAGLGIIAAGMIVLLLPLGAPAAMAGLVLFGLGCAPVYPCIIHATPLRFGADRSQAFIGVQMASAYLGTTLMPTLFGLIGRSLGMGFFPVFLLALLLLMILMHERLIRVTRI